MNPFIGQIMLFAGNFAPRGWAFCQGQLLPIAQNTALFSILGTTYGGDGRTTFGLPDLQGRMAVCPGRGPGLPTYTLGEKTGNPTTVLSVMNLPQSQVSYPASSANGDLAEPTNAVRATPEADPATDIAAYASSATGSMQPGGIIGAQNTAFSNEPPFLGMNYIVALIGTYPSRS